MDDSKINKGSTEFSPMFFAFEQLDVTLQLALLSQQDLD